MDNTNSGRKRCSFCGEDIRSDLRRCPYCGSLLDTKVDEFKEYVGNGLANNSMDIPVRPMDNMPAENQKASEESTENTKTVVHQEKFGPAMQEDGYNKSFANPEESEKKPDYQRNQILYDGHTGVKEEKTLGNGLKVFLTIICTIIPGFGQLAGIIIAIVFMNSDHDADRRSFGLALLVASVIFFIISCLSCFLIIVGISTMRVY